MGEDVNGDRKQDKSDEASQSNTATATQNSGTGQRLSASFTPTRRGAS